MSTLNEGKIVINKFVDYLSIEESLTDTNLYAIAVLADLKVNGYNLSTDRRLQKELTKILREQEIVSISNNVNDEVNDYKVSINSKSFVLELLTENYKLTLDEFIEVLDDKFGWDQDFVKHIKNIMTPHFYNAYFNANECLDESYAECWLINYKNKWSY